VKVISISVTVADCDGVDRLAQDILEAVSALALTDTVTVEIGEVERHYPFSIRVKGYSVHDAALAVLEAANGAVARFCGVSV